MSDTPDKSNMKKIEKYVSDNFSGGVISNAHAPLDTEDPTGMMAMSSPEYREEMGSLLRCPYCDALHAPSLGPGRHRADE